MNKKRWENYFKKDELIKHGSIMFIASFITGGLNYVYQIYMGRVLGPEQYGIFGTLFAIFYMIGIISQTLSTSTTRFTSKFIGEGKQIGFFIKGSMKQMFFLGIISSIIFFILRERLMSILKLHNIGPILVLIFILFLTWVSPMTNGILRGVKKFPELGFVNISNAFFKLIFGVVLVILGFGVSGAMFGIAVGMIFALIVSFIFIKPYIRPNNPHEPEFRFSSFYLYSLPVMFAMISYSIPANLDVVLAKYFFSAIDAGLYTSVSVLGKIIFFFPATIYAVMFPMITEKYVRGENTGDILKKSFLYTLFLSGPIVLVYILFPRLVIMIFGTNYISAIPLIAPYGLAMLFFSLTVILMYYHLAIKNMRYIALFSGFTIIEILLLLVFHSSIMEMTDVLLWANFVFLFVSMLYTWRVVL